MFYSGTMTSGFIYSEVRTTAFPTDSGYIISIYNYPNGTATITIPVYGYTTSNYALKQLPPPPKNWRWFDIFRAFKPSIKKTYFRKCQFKLRLINKKSSLSQVAHQKRRMFVQDLRRV